MVEACEVKLLSEGESSFGEFELAIVVCVSLNRCCGNDISNDVEVEVRILEMNLMWKEIVSGSYCWYIYTKVDQLRKLSPGKSFLLFTIRRKEHPLVDQRRVSVLAN